MHLRKIDNNKLGRSKVPKLSHSTSSLCISPILQLIKDNDEQVLGRLASITYLISSLVFNPLHVGAMGGLFSRVLSLQGSTHFVQKQTVTGLLSVKWSHPILQLVSHTI